MYGLRDGQLRQRVDEVLGVIGLADRQKDRVGTFSGGMKRRVNIGAALLHKPAVIIMDEPTVGIDPQSRRHILDNVKELNRQGMTVLYTTHYMEEAAELSHHIAIMDKGAVIAYGTHDELIRLVGEQTRIDLTLNAESARVLAAWQATKGVSRIDAQDGHVTALFPKPPSLLADNAKALTDGQIFEIITNGRGNMFPYGYRVKPNERWAVIAYVRAMQLKNGAVNAKDLTPDEINQLGSQP